MILNGLNCFPFLFCLLFLTYKSSTRNTRNRNQTTRLTNLRSTMNNYTQPQQAYYKTHAPLRLYETTKLLSTPMAILLLYPEILVAIFLCFLFLCHWRWSKTQTITNWPLVGMLPGLLQNRLKMHEYFTWYLQHNRALSNLRVLGSLARTWCSLVIP